MKTIIDKAIIRKLIRIPLSKRAPKIIPSKKVYNRKREKSINHEEY